MFLHVPCETNMIKNIITSPILVHYGIRTPAYADEHPLPQFVSGVGEYDGRVQITAFSEHPEEVGHMKIIIRRRYQPAPDLRETR